MMLNVPCQVCDQAADSRSTILSSVCFKADASLLRYFVFVFAFILLLIPAGLIEWDVLLIENTMYKIHLAVLYELPLKS